MEWRRCRTAQQRVLIDRFKRQLIVALLIVIGMWNGTVMVEKVHRKANILI